MTRAARRATVATAISMLAIGLPGCSGGNEQPAPAGSISEEDVRGRLGERIELEVEATEILGPRTFTVGGQAPGENPLLVVAAAVPRGLGAGDTVQVTGTVEVFDIASWEDVLQVEIEATEAEEYAGEPALRVDAVSLP